MDKEVIIYKAMYNCLQENGNCPALVMIGDPTFSAFFFEPLLLGTFWDSLIFTYV